MDLIHGGSVAALEDALRFRVARGSVLASNLANVDTSGIEDAKCTSWTPSTRL